MWAEPDIDTAAAYIEKIYRDKKLCTILGEKARKFIYSYYSDEKFYEDLKKLLVCIE